MSPTSLIALLPLLILGILPVIDLLVIAFGGSQRIVGVISSIGLALAFVSLPFIASSGVPRQVTPLLLLDDFALYFIGLFLLAGMITILLSYNYLKERPVNRGEYYVLLLLATLGSSVLAASHHFASFFLGLEILSISLYALIAYLPAHRKGIEASIKYLILAGASSAFLLFGLALVYTNLGVMDFPHVTDALKNTGNYGGDLIILAGLGMLIVGFGFKLALVPFHMWTADVYQGAPAPVTAFVATISKGGMVALLLRFFGSLDLRAYTSLFLVFSLIAAASMLIGNLLALLQQNVKRILAYSSIAHLGYLLVAFLAGGNSAAVAVAFYLAAYFVTTLGAFGVISVLSYEQREAESIDDYRGLFWRRPWLAGVFSGMLLSLAGIPLTAGFVGKFTLAAAGVGAALWVLVIILVVASAIGLYYYLRIIAAMISPSTESVAVASEISPLSLAGGLALAVLSICLIWLGVYPSPLINLIQAMVGAGS